MASIHFDITADNQDFLNKMQGVLQGVSDTKKVVESTGGSLEDLLSQFTKIAKGIENELGTMNNRMSSSFDKMKAESIDASSAISASFGKAIDSVGDKAGELQGIMDNAVGSIKNGFTQALGFAGLDMTIGGLERTATKMVEVREHFQDIESTMKTFLGDEQKGADYMNQLEAYAYNNAFEFSELATASQQLTAYGNSVNDLIPIIDKLSNVAAATHVPLMTMVDLFNRAKATGVVDGDAVQSWARQGLVIKDVLKSMGEEATGTSVTFEQLNKVLDHVTGEGGMFHGVMDAMMQNLSMSFGQLQDDVDLMFNDIGKKIQGPVKEMIDLADSLVGNYEQVAQVIGSIVAVLVTWKATSFAVQKGDEELYNQAQEARDNILKAYQNELSTLETIKDKKQEINSIKLDDDLSQGVANDYLSQNDAERIQKIRNEYQEEYDQAKDVYELELERNAVAQRNLEIANERYAVAQKDYDIQKDLQERGEDNDLDFSADELAAASKEKKTRAEEADTVATDLATASENLNTAEENLNSVATAQNTATTTINTNAKTANTVSTNTNTGAKTTNSLASKVGATAELLLNQAINAGTAALEKMKVAIMTNPLGVFVGAITLALPFIMEWCSDEEDATQATDDFNKSVNATNQKLNLAVTTLKTAKKGTEAYTEALSEVNGMAEEYGTTLFKEGSQIDENTHAYQELEKAIRAETRAKIENQAITDAGLQQQKDEEEAYNNLVDAASSASTREANPYAPVNVTIERDSESIRQITEASWSYITSAVAKYKDEMVKAYGEGGEAGEKALEDVKKKVSDIMAQLVRATGANEDELKQFMPNINKYVDDIAKGAIGANNQIKSIQDQLAKLSDEAESGAMKIETSYGSMDFSQLMTKLQELETKKAELEKKTKIGVDDSELQDVLSKIKEVKTALSDLESKGSASWLSKQITEAKKKRDSLNKKTQTQEWNLWDSIIYDLLEQQEKENSNNAEARFRKQQQDKKKNSKTDKNAAKNAASTKQAYQDELKKQTLENKRADEDAEMEAEQYRINAMADSTAKTIAQIELDKKKEQIAIERATEDLKKSKIEQARTLWEKNPANKKAIQKGATFNESSVDTSLTANEQLEIQNRVLLNLAKYNKSKEELEDGEIQARIDYLKQYGSLEQQRLAITEETERKIAELEERGASPYEIASARNEGDANLDELNSSKIFQDMNWDALFGDIEGHSKSFLENLKSQAQELLDSGQLTDIEDIEKVQSKINDINEAIDQSSILYTILGDKQSKRNRLLKEEADALDNLKTAQKNESEAQTDVTNLRSDIESKFSEYDMATEFKDSEDAVNILREAGFDKDSDEYKELSDLISQLSNSETKLVQATKDKNDAQVKANNATDATKKTPKEIFEQVQENLASLPDLFDSLGLSSEGVQQGLDGLNAGMGAVTDFMSGNYIGALTKGVTSINDFGESLGVWSNSNRAEVEKENNRLANAMSVNTEAINRNTKAMSEGSATEKYQSYQQAEALMKANETFAQQTMLNNAGMYDGSHSVTHNFNNAYGGGTLMKQISSIVGKTVNTLQDVLSLSAEDLNKFYTTKGGTDVLTQLTQGIINSQDTGNYTGLAEDLLDYINSYNEEAYEELQNTFKEGVTGESFDSFKDSFKSALMDMDKDASDFADDFTEKLTESVLDARINDLFADEIQDLYDQWSNALSDDNDISSDEVARLQEAQEELVQKMQAERDRIAEITGYDEVSSSEASGSINGIQSISEDTANELVGRMTAIQLSVETGNGIRSEIAQQVITGIAQLTGIASASSHTNEILDSILIQHVQSNNYLEDVVRYNKAMYEEWGSQISSMRQKIENL